MAVNQEISIYAELRKRLRGARRVFVLTGAGVYAESGVPTLLSELCYEVITGKAGEILPLFDSL